MKLHKDIQELQDAKVITPETAVKIEEYYLGKGGSSQSRLLAIFGVIGGLLVGMGLTLIVAHNWDNLSRGLKTFFAFLPLLISQAGVGFALWKKSDSTAWREGSSSVLFFAIAACISMISQIYNIEGDLVGFVLTWTLLTLPIAFIMRSSMVGLLCLIGVTYLGVEQGYMSSYPYEGINWYWLLFPLILGYYIYARFKQPGSNFLTFFNWLLPISFTLCLGTILDNNEEWILLGYMSLFGLFFAIGSSPWFQKVSLGANGFKVLGSFGMIGILLGASFQEILEEFTRGIFTFASFEFIIFLVITILAIGLLGFNYYKRKTIALKEFVFLAFIAIFILGTYSNIAIILINILVLAIGVITIKEGVEQFKLSILNYGLLIIAALIICRFFDTDISFVFRGLMFVFVGIGFFTMNYWLLKKRNHAEK